MLDNLIRHGYNGAVYPVNPSAPAVHSIRAYPSVEAIPDEVDLAWSSSPSSTWWRWRRRAAARG
jgi:acyl-CoA synthetase (NDP forming)